MHTTQVRHPGLRATRYPGLDPGHPGPRAGNQELWIPAFAGMTASKVVVTLDLIRGIPAPEPGTKNSGFRLSPE